VSDLAAAPDDEVFKLWEGLGYYSRCRNLLATARHIAGVLGGRFPDTYADIRALKGVGDYTAAAIGSFAFELPHAVVDGNVYRVLARWAGLNTPTDTTEGKRLFTTLAQQVLDTERPGAHNQAMMDFGATWCTPQTPRCGSCPFAEKCVARQTGRVAELPVKSKKMIKKERFLLYFVLKSTDGTTWLRQRSEGDIWAGLYEFPMLELPEKPADGSDWKALFGQWLSKQGGQRPGGSLVLTLPRSHRQTLTHRVVTAFFVEVNWPAGEALPAVLDEFTPVRWAAELPGVAVPRVVEWYWRERHSGAPTLF
jgi:A/G-specific adenine glycosylase